MTSRASPSELIPLAPIPHPSSLIPHPSALIPLREPRAKTIGHGIAPVFTETPRRDAHTDRRLAPLVLILHNETGNARDVIRRDAARNDVFQIQVHFDVPLHDRIEDRIRWQAVLV